MNDMTIVPVKHRTCVDRGLTYPETTEYFSRRPGRGGQNSDYHMTATNLEWAFEPTLSEFKADLVKYLRPYVCERFEEIYWALQEHLRRQTGHKMSATMEMCRIDLPEDCPEIWALFSVEVRRSHPPRFAAYVGSPKYIQGKADDAKANIEKALSKVGVKGVRIEQGQH